MNFFDKIFSNKKERDSKNQAFFDEYMSNEQRDTVLEIINKIVDSQNYIFFYEEKEVYNNKNLRLAIEISTEIKQLQDYITNPDGYKGVELNDDVLKTSIVRLLSEIDYYLFYSFFGNIEELTMKVRSTPINMLKYILSERSLKIKEDLETMNFVNKDLALNILEYDMLFQTAKAYNIDLDYSNPKTIINEFEEMTNDLFLEEENVGYDENDSFDYKNINYYENETDDTDIHDLDENEQYIEDSFESYELKDTDEDEKDINKEDDIENID